MVFVQPSVKATQQVFPTRTFEETSQEIADHINGIRRVKLGDTLWSIAEEEGTTVDQLVDWNGIEDLNSIVVGQRLRVR